jgi:hypothetical protein
VNICRCFILFGATAGTVASALYNGNHETHARKLCVLGEYMKVSVCMKSTTSHNRSHVHDTISSKGQVVASINNKDWEWWCNGISILPYFGGSRFEYRLHSRVNWVHFWIFSVSTDIMNWNTLQLPAPRSLLRPFSPFMTMISYTWPCGRKSKCKRTCTVSNVTLRRVRVSNVAVEKQKKYCIFWVCVCSLSHPACKPHTHYYVVTCRLFGLYNIFPHAIFGKNVIEHKMCVDFLYSLCLMHFSVSE